MSVTIGQFADVSNLILAAAMDPSRWQQVVDALGQVLGTRICTQIMGYDNSSKAAPLAYTSGYDPQILSLYEAEYYFENPYARQFDTMSVGKVTSAGQLCRPDVMTKTGFYNDLLRPLEDIIYGGGAMLARDDSRMFLFGGNMRAKDQEKYERQWLSLCAQLTPVFRQALEISRVISGLAFEKWAANQHKLGEQTAVLVVDTDLRVHYVSAQAERLLEKGELIKTGLSHQMMFTSRTAQSSVAQLARLQSGSRQPMSRSWNLATPGGEKWTCRAIGLQLGDLDRSPFGAFLNKSTTAILLALKAETPDVEVGAMVQAALGLSHVESEIALMLADGMTAAEVAEHRTVSIHTVRNQIKSALSKSGCRRQADLVKAVEQVRRSSPAAVLTPVIT